MYKLKEIISYEKKIYQNYMFPSIFRYFISRIKREPSRMIWRWQKISRIVDYFRFKCESGSWFYKPFYFIFICIRNRYAERFGLDLGTHNIGKGLLIYHGNIVVNGYSTIGENLHLHGSNVIGNSGPEKPSDCPTIGNNVMLGAGAKVLGPIFIADNIKVAAGAVVVHSFYEPGITIAGVPAKRVK